MSNNNFQKFNEYRLIVIVILINRHNSKKIRIEKLLLIKKVHSNNSSFSLYKEIYLTLKEII